MSESLTKASNRDVKNSKILNILSYKFLNFVVSECRRQQILGTFAMSEPQGLVALPLDPGSYLANTSSLTLALV